MVLRCDKNLLRFAVLQKGIGPLRLRSKVASGAGDGLSHLPVVLNSTGGSGSSYSVRLPRLEEAL